MSLLKSCQGKFGKPYHVYLSKSFNIFYLDVQSGYAKKSMVFNSLDNASAFFDFYSSQIISFNKVINW